MLLRELTCDHVTQWFWTDSSVVLGYIGNDSRRFHVFVSNRVKQIRDHTEPSQWKHVSTRNNPADVASRGATADDLVKHTNWLRGPEFLWKNDPFVECDILDKPVLSPDDPEVKKVQVFDTVVEPASEGSLLDCLEYFSDWTRAKRAVALCLEFKRMLRTRSIRRRNVSVEDLQNAEVAIVKLVQENAFKEDIELLRASEMSSDNCDQKRKCRLKGTSSLCGLDPFLDERGILRVGGRIRQGEFSTEMKHPVILPRKAHITELVVRHFHQIVRHQGRGITTNEIRANGFWIIGCSSAVSSCIYKCVTCRKLRGCSQGQKMADLPADRLQSEPPFTFSGMDLFGPFYIKEGRKELKRYSVLFTCMSSRAIHLKTANSLDTSSFINALRRFLSIRGPVRQLRSDRGTNFVGAERELKEVLLELDDQALQRYLSDKGCDYIGFKMNVPSASHMGGVWERQIRSVRNVLASLMHQSSSQLDDETLRIFLCEVSL
ncbi:uncharacterized protein LOC132560424 [Ylistrum balloti]|uniref:uncharacterized protein LOC132560424 n=1 Tax=Ylistrum balloti TaxID=509963 RepID=UPI00290585EB|nr:uncharacterized protein LOC132560424 [Ylistrum balloti]